METIGVRHLKTHLSGYLRRVQQGEHILVTDHGRVVAELSPPRQATLQSSTEARYQLVVAEGIVRPAVAPTRRDWVTMPGGNAPAGTAQALIDADRGE
jgi:prevent-host-death family protein